MKVGDLVMNTVTLQFDTIKELWNGYIILENNTFAAARHFKEVHNLEFGKYAALVEFGEGLNKDYLIQ